MLNNKGNYQILTSFFFIITVVVSILVLIYFGLNSSVTSAVFSKEIQPIQNAVGIKDSISKCWGEFDLFAINSADTNKCFALVKEEITGYRIELIDFLRCGEEDFNYKDFGDTMNCKTKIPFVINLKKKDRTNCLARMTLCFNKSKKPSFVELEDESEDESPPTTTISGCDNGQSNYSTNDFEVITFNCSDNVSCQDLNYSISEVGKDLVTTQKVSYNEQQKKEFFIDKPTIDTNYKINFYSIDKKNSEEPKEYYCAIKGENYVNPELNKVFLLIDTEEIKIDFSTYFLYEVESRQIVIIKANVNKKLENALFSIDYNVSTCVDENITLLLEPSLINTDYNYYGRWIIPSDECNGKATGKIILEDLRQSIVSDNISFDINSIPFDVVVQNRLLDFNMFNNALGRKGRVAGIVTGKDLDKTSCYFSVNGGVNWIKGDWNNDLGGCDSGLIDLNNFGLTQFIFNTKISNTFGETGHGQATSPYFVDESPPKIVLFPICPSNYSKKNINVYISCIDYPSGGNVGCGENSIFYRIDNGSWVNISPNQNITFNTDGNYFLEAYSIDMFGYISEIFSSYCAIDKKIYLRNAQIKDSNLYLGVYRSESDKTTLYHESTNILEITPNAGVYADLNILLPSGVDEGMKLRLCFDSGKCSSEVNVIKIQSGDKSKNIQFCGGSFNPIQANDVCLFSSYELISDVNEDSCEYSIDGSDWMPADYNTFNTKSGCKVIIPELVVGGHYLLIRAQKNNGDIIYSPSSKVNINQTNLNVSCLYSGCD